MAMQRALIDGMCSRTHRIWLPPGAQCSLAAHVAGMKRKGATMQSDNANPQHHVQNVRQRLGDLANHLREDVSKVDEPQLKAVFETSAEVLLGLDKALEDYQRKNEPAWKQ
jgi:hypothetical protein